MKAMTTRLLKICLLTAVAALPALGPSAAGQDIERSSTEIEVLAQKARAAIYADDYVTLRNLLDSGKKIINIEIKNRSLLGIAAADEDEEAVRILLNQGANPNGGKGERPLEEALTTFNMIPFESPKEVLNLRRYVPDEMAQLRQHLRTIQQVRMRILLLLLEASANYNFKPNVSYVDSQGLPFFDTLVLTVCDSRFFDKSVLNILKNSGFMFFLPNKNLDKRIYAGTGAGLFNAGCVEEMHGIIRAR